MLLLLIVARAPQALVLPSTGLFVQHGVVTLGADRYAYLPLLLLAAPALATALHSIATAEEAAHAEAPRRFPRGTYGELCLLVLGGLGTVGSGLRTYMPLVSSHNYEFTCVDLPFAEDKAPLNR